MNSSKISKYLLVMFLVTSIAFLIFRSSPQNLADTGIYIETGKQVFDGENPYLSGARTGAIGTLLMYILSLLIPNSIVSTVFQLLNLFGIYIFALKILPRKIKPEQFLILITLLTWTSPIREILVCHQITGIIFGLVSFSLIRSDKINAKIDVSLLARALSLSVAVDLKPHLALGAVIISVIFFKQYKIVAFTIFFYVCIYTYLYLKLDAPLHRQWFANINEIDDINTENKWNDISNVWPIADEFFGHQQIWYNLSLICSGLLLFLIALSSKRLNANVAVVLWGVWPIFSNYSHLYDLVILTILLTYYLIFQFKNIGALPILCFLIVPIQISLLRNQILILVFLVIFILIRKIYVDKSQIQGGKEKYLSIFVPFFYFVNNLNYSVQIRSSLLVTELFICCVGCIWYYYLSYSENLTKDPN